MRLLAVDFGEKRIGLAVSDEAGAVVVPLGVLSRRSDAQAVAEVAAAARERGVSRIVVGHPRRAGGLESLPARRARNFARRLEEFSGLPVDLHDETLTSRAADEALDDAGLPRARRRGRRDSEAAAALLRDYLSPPRPGPGAP